MPSNDRLEEKLKSLSIPKPSDELKKLQLQHARLAFDYADRSFAAEPAPGGRHFFVWGSFAGAVAALALVFIILPRAALQPSFQTANADRLRLLHEMQTVFGASLQAVVQNGGGPRVILSDEARQNSSFPVILEISDGGKQYHVISFSGERLELPIAGKKISLEIYLTGDGKVVLVSDRGVMQGDHATALDGFKVQAQALEVM